MLNIWFIMMILFGFFFIFLFVIATLAVKGKISNSEKIMSIFNIKLFDDPIVVEPKTGLAIMTLISISYLMFELWK